MNGEYTTYELEQLGIPKTTSYDWAPVLTEVGLARKGSPNRRGIWIFSSEAKEFLLSRVGHRGRFMMTREEFLERWQDKHDTDDTDDIDHTDNGSGPE